VTYSRAFRRWVLAAFAVAFVAVAWGGVVRATGSGMGCADDWPLCQGQLLPAAEAASVIEWIHRALALLSGVTVFAVAFLAVRRYTGRALSLALAAVPLFLLQALLGAVAVWLALPHEWVTLHFANAQLLLGVLTALLVETRLARASAGERSSAWTWLVAGAAAATYLLQLSGAFVRASGATAACRSWPACDGALIFPTAGAPGIHMLHRYLAVAVGVLIVYAAIAAWRRRREIPGAGPAAAWTLGLFALQVAVGAATPLTGFSAVPLAAHPGVASALWCATVALAVVAWRPPAGARETLRDVISLTKPAIMSLLLLTAVGGAFLAAQGVPPVLPLVATVVGGALASGGASSLNHYFDRDIDERMRRTRRRPLAAHRIPNVLAILVGVLFNVAAFAVLALWANLLAAALALSGTLFYVIVYTLWLKRITPQNIVIGGAAGAVPPLVGWAAVAGSLDLAAWLLFAIVFFWTPAHFWALAILIKDDYERAGVPMLPVVRGDVAAIWGILWYATALIPLSILVFVIGAAGPLYLAAALALGAVFLGFAVRLVRGTELRRRALARALYLYSLLYLALLFTAIVVDSAVRT
jgi:protoheme IX farnesyltransferase